MLSKRHANHRMGPDATPPHVMGTHAQYWACVSHCVSKLMKKRTSSLALLGRSCRSLVPPGAAFSGLGEAREARTGREAKGGAECAHSAGPSRATLHPETGMQRLHPHSPRRSPPPLVVFLFLPSSSSPSSLLHLVPLLRPSHQCPGPPPPTHSSS